MGVEMRGWRLRAWYPLIRTCADDSWNSMNPYILVHYCVTLRHVYGMTDSDRALRLCCGLCKFAVRSR